MFIDYCGWCRAYVNRLRRKKGKKYGCAPLLSRYPKPMSLYKPGAVTLWAINGPSREQLAKLFEFSYDDDDENEPSPFAKAYRITWYDEDFAELHTGGTIQELLKIASEYARTLDEQALSRIPEGEWNAMYLLFGSDDNEWSHPNKRPPMPHGIIDIEGAKFKLIDTFHILWA